jgi:hypothetical protein
MKILCSFILGLWLASISVITLASGLLCPDPNQSSLRYGVIPAPWEENPFSPNTPQGEQNTRFIQVKLLFLNRVGRQIVCFYKNSLGEYSIRQMVRCAPDAKPIWIRVDEGYACRDSLQTCQFYTES